jgi:hypothetical protein
MKAYILILVILLYAASIDARGPFLNADDESEDVSVKTTSAQMVCSVQDGNFSGKVTITLDKSFDAMPPKVAEANKLRANYRIVRLTSGATSDFLTDGAFPLDNIGNSITFDIPGTFNFAEDSVGFGLLANNASRVKGAIKLAPSLTVITVSDTCTPPPPDLPSQSKPKTKTEFKALSYFKALSVDTTKFSWKFAMDGTKGTRRYFTNEVDVQPVRITGYRFGGRYEVIPAYVKFRFSGNEKSPVNTLELGFKINHLRAFHDDGESVPHEEDYKTAKFGITSSLSSRIETDWFFNKEVNWVTGWTSGVQMNLFHSNSKALRINPYIGIESGYRIKSKSAITKEPWIARPLMGATLYFAPYRTEKKTPVAFEIDYIRRFFLRPEPQYVVIDGKEVFNGVSERTRDYVHGKITFNADGVFSPYIEYKYGRVPPKYTLENSRYTVGIQFSLDRGDK